MNKLLVSNSADFYLIRPLICRFFASSSNGDSFNGLNDSFQRFSGHIPKDRFEKKFVRSSGPGGQNVNKRNTKAVIRFDIKEADWIPDKIKERFIKKYKRLVSNKNTCQVTADTTKFPDVNQEECFEKLKNFLFECQNELLAEIPREPTKEEIALIEERKSKANFWRLENKRRDKLHRKMMKGDF